MTKNPIINAGAAALYICVVATGLFYGQVLFGGVEETILIPIAMLSLFVLSAAVMGYIFLSEPIQMILDGKKREGVQLFLHTVAAFACITIAAFLLLATLSVTAFSR